MWKVRMPWPNMLVAGYWPCSWRLSNRSFVEAIPRTAVPDDGERQLLRTSHPELFLLYAYCTRVAPTSGNRWHVVASRWPF